jgi:hypothetical protein
MGGPRPSLSGLFEVLSVDALLFLGIEYLRKMTASDLTAEERENYQQAFAAFITTEEGLDVPLQLVRAFNRLSVEETLSLSMDVLLWYLDWLGAQTDSIQDSVDGNSLARLWFAFPDQLFRTRSLNLLLQFDLQKESSPSESMAATIHRHYMNTAAEKQLPEDQQSSINLFIDILLTDAILPREGTFARKVLRYCLADQPDQLITASLANIQQRLDELTPGEANSLRAEIWPE